MLKIFISFGVICVLVQLACAQNFNGACVNAHNKYRKLHGVPNLTADNTLVQYAQRWANTMARTGQFKHSQGKYGENLYALFGGSGVSCDQAVKSWYDEIAFYNWNKPDFSSKTGHFTQVVWKGTTKVGCATAQGKNRSYYVVCSYNPPGNFIGQFQANVLRKK